MHTKRKMNLKQLAEKIGVSTATISNAFSRPDQLSEKLRERILKEAEANGFHAPNLASQMLRSGASNVVGVMLSDTLQYSLSDAVANQVLQGIAKVLADNNKHMLLLSSQVESKEQRLAESLPDGFIFYGTTEYGTVDKPIVNRIVKTGRPVVIVDFYVDGVSSINIDNQHAAYEIAKHAMKSENLEIAVLGLKLLDIDRISRLTQEDFDSKYTEITRTRLKGFMLAAADSNCKIDAHSIWHVPINSAQQAEIAAREALNKYPRPQVVLCMSDVIALATLKVARELKINVPNDLVVTGFDGIPASESSTPRLTTVCQQSVHKGIVAAELLMSGERDKHIILDTKVEIRESTFIDAE